jgi:oligopeptide/dipeptide ABC transporter ATP-binding protein
MMTLLEVRGLGVSYTTRNGHSCPALTGVSFTLERGEILGVLGESGSGKSTLAATLLRVLPPAGQIHRGIVVFEGRDLLRLDAGEMEKVRGGRIAMVFQEPSLALHPTIRVDAQINAVLAAHQNLKAQERSERTREVLSAVFPAGVDQIAKKYPHELSGGQRARVLIALALSCDPSVVVADEPTASLDPETQQEIISLFRKSRQASKVAVIWITHSPATLSDFADRVMVLYAGQVVEIGLAERVLSAPQHPYTRSLLRCLPPEAEEGFARHKEKLPIIPGEAAPSRWNWNQCSFEPRCNERMAVCTMRAPQMVRLDGRHEVSCFRYEDEIGR